MNLGTLTLPILGAAAIAFLALLYWNEVSAERDKVSQDKDIYAKVGIRFARHAFRLALEFLITSLIAAPVLSLILVLVAYTWWEVNRSILAPFIGAIGGGLAIWQIVRWTNRSRTNHRGPPTGPESPPESN
jgi:hypothetical protein